jgi:hypothetical protein
VVTPILSAKDAAGRRLDSFPLHELPLYGVVA